VAIHKHLDLHLEQGAIIMVKVVTSFEHHLILIIAGVALLIGQTSSNLI